jgi:hypothetical protein
MALLADLFGPTTDTRLLVLAQDSLELRPTGGYIGSYGVLHFDRGVARLEVFGATEDLPAPSPPLPAPADLAPWLPDAWGLSNANWWPDFPTTAAAAREMYRRQGGPEVDGVLALTENAIATLIGALGPLHVPGYDRPVTEDGFEDRVVYEVELKRPPDQPRKRFLVELAKVLFDRLVQVPSDQLSGAAQAIGRSVGSGDVQLWFADEGRQSRIKGTVVAGELPAPAGDFLLVVDANLTASKANLGLRKQIDYRVRRAGRNRVVGRLDVEVRNEGPATDVNRYYNGYLRVYVPRGSRLLSGNAQQRLKAAEDGPFDVLTDRVVVSPGERRTVRFEYELPRSVHAGSDYRLVWLRQPGTPRDTLRASVGTRATVADPGERRMQLAQRIEGRGIAESIRSIFHGLR